MGVFIAEQPRKRGVRDRRRHLGRARKSVGASDKARGRGWRDPQKNHLPENRSSASRRF